MRETEHYLFEEKKQLGSNIGVIHVYRKTDNAWVGFIRYVREVPKTKKPFVKFHPSDLGNFIDADFKKELKEFSQSLSKEWINEGKSGFNVGNDLDIKLTMIIDKGDGTKPKKVIV